MRLASLLLLMPLTACTAAASEPPAAGEPTATCRGEGLSAFTGQAMTDALGKRMLAETGARDLRVVTPDMMVTMDFRADRLTVHVDAANRVLRAACG